MKFNNQNYNIKIWDGESLGKYIAVDTETTIVPFTKTPDLVTFQAYAGGDDVFYVPRSSIKSFLGKHYFSNLIFINAPFDIDTIAKEINGYSELHDFYDSNSIHDIGVLYRLLHLAVEGYVPFKYNLKFLAERYLNVVIEKDERRENFSQFINHSIGDIPEEYLEYGAIDVICTFNLYFTLKGLIQPYDTHGTMLSMHIQCKGDWALTQIYKNGIGFDLLQRDKWLIGVDKEMERNADILASWGWVRGKKGIKEDYERIMKALSLYDKLPKTENGDLSSKSDDLEPYKNKSQFVKAYLEYQTLEKASSFVRDITSSTVNPRYNLLVNTGRTSCIAEGQMVTCLNGEKPIENIKIGDYVYSYNYKNKLELKKVTNVYKQGVKRTIKINWKSIGNGKTGSLVCTPDHKIKVREVSNPFFKQSNKKEGWYRADELRSGDRLFHLTRSAKPYSRPRLYSADLQGLHEQLLVKEQLFNCYDHSRYEIHHKNNHKWCNTLDNLEILEKERHAEITNLGRIPWNKDKQVRVSFKSLEELKDLYRQYYFTDKNNTRLYDFIKRECRKSGIKLRDISRVFHEGKEITLEILLKATVLTTRKAEALTGLDYRTLKKAMEFEDLSINHVVEGVEEWYELPTYDIEVEDNHNFIASEICVHNCSKPNIQQLPRLGGIREMFIPQDPNNTFIISDYSAIELATLAQVTYSMYGESVMRDRINEGEDLHRYYASVMHGCPISEVTKEWRQEAKACFSGDTELLTREGWVRIEDIDKSVDIMQYNPHTKELSFTKPLGYVEFEDKELLHITNDYTDCMVTSDHRMLRISRSGHVEETLAENIENNEQYSFVHGGFYKKTHSKTNGLLTRLAVMIQADGSFCNKDGVKFGFSKDRKINRFKQLMEEAGIPFTTYVKDSVTFFRINMGSELQSLLTVNKEFTRREDYCAESFIDELWRWDGSAYGKHGKIYCNTSLRSIEVAQEILITNGYKSSIQTHVDRDINHKDCYRLCWYVGDRKKNPQYGRLSGISSVKVDGLHKVYCPSVPTSWVLTRRNGKVSIQGNCNFGYPGGLGPDTFIEFARGYGLDLTRQQAEHMKEIWFEAFPEMREYMKNEIGKVYTLTGRRRGRTSYCAEKNTPFQGLAADGAKLALYNLSKAGFKTVIFCHDECVSEVPAHKAEELLKLQEEIMIQSMKIVVPDVDVRVESNISDFYTK